MREPLSKVTAENQIFYHCFDCKKPDITHFIAILLQFSFNHYYRMVHLRYMRVRVCVWFHPLFSYRLYDSRTQPTSTLWKKRKFLFLSRFLCPLSAIKISTNKVKFESWSSVWVLETSRVKISSARNTHAFACWPLQVMANCISKWSCVYRCMGCLSGGSVKYYASWMQFALHRH